MSEILAFLDLFLPTSKKPSHLGLRGEEKRERGILEKVNEQ